MRTQYKDYTITTTRHMGYSYYILLDKEGKTIRNPGSTRKMLFTRVKDAKSWVDNQEA